MKKAKSLSAPSVSRTSGTGSNLMLKSRYALPSDIICYPTNDSNYKSMKSIVYDAAWNVVVYYSQ